MTDAGDSITEANGFLVLDHCDVYIARDERDDCSKDATTLDPWFDVEIPPPQDLSDNLLRQTQKSATVNAMLNPGSSDCVNADCCPHCYLVLAKRPSFRETKQLSVKGLEGSNGPRYDGTIRDTKDCRGSERQRSDAALMMGLALLSQDLGHIAIRSIKVGLYNTASRRDFISSNDDHPVISCTTPIDPKVRGDNSVYRRDKACLLIAFWCREMTGLALPNQQRRFFQHVTKQPLHPATQLIMSIMSSDWNEYDAKIAELSLLSQVEEHGRKRKSNDTDNIDDSNSRSGIDTNGRQSIPSISFFPSKLNLEDVFQRISGISSSLLLSGPEIVKFKRHNDENGNERINSDRQQESENSNTNNTVPPSKFAMLPADILRHNIGQYLRAKSLDSLRCTCRHLHWTLRAVVPGLKLRLYSHQMKSLMWMRGRELKHITEDDLLQGQRRRHRPRHSTRQTQNMAHWIKNTPDGDAHRAATGGGTVVLYPRRWKRRDGSRYDGDIDSYPDKNGTPMRISQLDHSEVMERRNHGNGAAVVGGHSAVDNPLARKVARGGLLCDDPGLGKTITVISLILQTLGVSTEKNDSYSSNQGKSQLSESTGGYSAKSEGTKNGEFTMKASEDQPENALTPNNERIFDEYWKEQIIPEFRCQALTKLFSTFLRCSFEINYFFDNYWVKELRSKNIDMPSKPQLSLKEIQRRINRSMYGDSLVGFVSDVESCFHNAITNDHVSDPIRGAAQQLIIQFRNRINAFRRSQIEIAIKSFSRASAKPDSMVAALIQKSNTEKLRRALMPSSATLMVVPAVLVDHWIEQIKLNIDLSYCTNKSALVVEYTGSINSTRWIREIILKCRVEKTHFPLVFVDRTATKKLPPPSFLAMFKIVLTTNNRFSSEWKNGSFEDEIRRNRKQNSRGKGNGRMTDFREDLATSEEACPLLKVNWLRMIVDEGHSMGRGRDTSSISFASWINADRRWAMTGTPTPQTSLQSGLINVSNLLHYLQHDFFTRRYDGDIIWNKLIVKSWNAGCVSAFFRLRSLLSMIMIRHVKSDISELPLPIFDTHTLSMGFEEVSTYNTLVCAIQSNLIITSMKGETSGAQDSLLHRSQARHAKEALSNLRLVCAGGTQVRPTLSTEYWVEFHQDFDKCNADPVQQKKIREFISQATTGRQSKCDCCSIMLSTLLVFPCGHLVCTECVDSSTTSCVVCEKEFDVDAFQRLQPGFKYDWLHNVDEETKLRSIHNDGKSQDANEPSLLLDGSGLLVPHNQRRRRARTRKYGDGHTCEYDPQNPSGRCILCFVEHEPCYLAGDRRCRVCYRVAQDCPTSESKNTHIIEKLLRLYRQQEETKKSNQIKIKKKYESSVFVSERRRTPKVIIFSQFRKALNITGDRLLRRFGSGCIAEYWGKYRKQELQKFIKDGNCICMLLGKDGSEGLDLSFVTHIIFLEQVWDKSLENQVVARACRIGAKGFVDVETLVAQNSIEQTMLFLERKLEQDQSDNNGSVPGIEGFCSTAKDKKRSEYQQAKVHYLLKNLKLIANANTLDFNASNKRKVSVDLEARLDTQHSGTRKKAERNGQKRLRVKFQDQ